MSKWLRSFNIPLALLAGAAIASNPRWLPWVVSDEPSEKSEPQQMSAVEAVRALEAVQNLDIESQVGPESSALKLLRQAEEHLVQQMDAQDLAKEFEKENDAFRESGGVFAGLNRPDLPIAGHFSVQRYVDYFASDKKGRKIFSAWLKRSGRYRELVGSALRKKGLPADLEAMVFVESGFLPKAKSSAGAVGLWQFMPATARAYGLKVHRQMDERRNPWRSSEAAAAHLSDLYARFKSWDLAMAAYNYGYHNVSRKMDQIGARDFWDLADEDGLLPKETRRYVPKIHAVALLLNNLEEYGFSASDVDSPLRAAIFKAPSGSPFDLLARAAGTTEANIHRLNPEFLGSKLPHEQDDYVVRVPRESLARARTMLPSLLGGLERGNSDLVPVLAETISEQVKQRLAKTALSPAEQRAALPSEPARKTASVSQATSKSPSQNKLSSQGGAVSAKNPEPSAPQKRANQERVEQKQKALPSVKAIQMKRAQKDYALAYIRYRVSRGESLSELAARFGVTESELVRDNKIDNPSKIFHGQLLKVRSAKKVREQELRYQVRPGDSLDLIAIRHFETRSRLAQANSIIDPNHIEVGQVIIIPPQR